MLQLGAGVHRDAGAAPQARVRVPGPVWPPRRMADASAAAGRGGVRVPVTVAVPVLRSPDAARKVTVIQTTSPVLKKSALTAAAGGMPRPILIPGGLHDSARVLEKVERNEKKKWRSRQRLCGDKCVGRCS
jgi:hypothetical protein